ncbi:MAG: DUF4290 domain-containing protein [Solirubrobacteraceae bacterium]
MNYNTAKEKLVIPEYGRYIQNMINHCLSIEDKEKRNNCAKSIIEVMGNLNPHLRDVPEFQHKLWDQLFIISKFKLEVESPYPISSPDIFIAKPDKLKYPTRDLKYRFYGVTIKKMIKEGVKWENEEKKQALFFAIANQMKKNYSIWNRDKVEDSVIFDNLLELSNGEINLKLNNQPLMNVSDAKSPSLKKRNNINTIIKKKNKK